jgi:hypothetical protein
MRAMLAKVEVQRVLILAFMVCVLAGAIARAPFELIVLLAASATAWAFLLGWSLTLDSALARGVRIGIGAGAAAGCAAALGAAPAGVVAVALAASALLGGTERLLHRRVAT